MDVHPPNLPRERITFWTEQNFLLLLLQPLLEIFDLAAVRLINRSVSTISFFNQHDQRLLNHSVDACNLPEPS